MGMVPPKVFLREASKSTKTLQICIISALLFFAFSIGTALAPNLVAFFIFRILTAFQGTAFLIVGASCIGDMYKPVCNPRLSHSWLDPPCWVCAN